MSNPLRLPRSGGTSGCRAYLGTAVHPRRQPPDAQTGRRPRLAGNTDLVGSQKLECSRSFHSQNLFNLVNFVSLRSLSKGPLLFVYFVLLLSVFDALQPAKLLQRPLQ